MWIGRRYPTHPLASGSRWRSRSMHLDATTRRELLIHAVTSLTTLTRPRENRSLSGACFVHAAHLLYRGETDPFVVRYWGVWHDTDYGPCDLIGEKPNLSRDGIDEHAEADAPTRQVVCTPIKGGVMKEQSIDAERMRTAYHEAGHKVIATCR